MADLAPIAGKLAKFVRLLGATQRGERAAAFRALQQALETAGADWTDLGDWIEQPGNGKFSEAEMQELFDAGRRQGVEEGIKLGMVRASNGGGNSHGSNTLPTAPIMAAYCYQRRDQLNDWEREFIDGMHIGGKTRWLTLKRKSKLQDIYQQLGGT
jgi:hypothetical protein